VLKHNKLYSGVWWIIIIFKLVLFLLCILFIFLRLRQARHAGGDVVFSTCPSVRPSITKLVNTVFWKRMNQFWCQWAQWSAGQGRETINFIIYSFSRSGQEVKGQGHTRPKIDLESGGGIILDPLGSSSFSNLSFLFTYFKKFFSLSLPMYGEIKMSSMRD